MGMKERVGVLILYVALVYHVGAAKKVMPVAGPDIYKNKNLDQDILLPGEKINNVISFGAKADGKFDCTQVYIYLFFNHDYYCNTKFLVLNHDYKCRLSWMHGEQLATPKFKPGFWFQREHLCFLPCFSQVHVLLQSP